MTKSAIARAGRRFLSMEASFDLRGLAVFRIVAGLALVAYVLGRIDENTLVAFHTDLGVLPGAIMRESTRGSAVFSLLYYVSTATGARLLEAAMIAVFLCLAGGVCTRVTSALTLLALLTLHHRNPLVTTGAQVFMNVAAAWAVFLPLGEVWSFDAWWKARRSAREITRRARVVTLLALGLRLHLFFVYFLNVVQKDGESWRTGQAFHRVLWSSWTATPAAFWLRAHEPAWLSPTLSFATLAIEAVIALLVVSPLGGRACRRVAAALIVLLHVSIHVWSDLGLFVYSLPMLALLLLTTDDWSGFESRLLGRLERWAPRIASFARATGPSEGATSPSPDRTEPPLGRLAVGAREGYAVLLAIAVSWNVWAVNIAPTRWFGATSVPKVVQGVVDFLDIPGGWHLFAPDVPDRDARIVVDAVMRDGRHVDPLTGRAPDFDVVHHGPWRWHYLWQSYHLELCLRNERVLWVPFVEYLRRVPTLERWRGDREIVSVEVFVVSIRRPAFGRAATPARVALAAAWP